MALSWQQGPLASGATGRFLTAAPLPQRLLYLEPLRRRMRVRLGETWIVDAEDVLLQIEIDGIPLRAASGQAVNPHGSDREITPPEAVGD